MEYLITAVGLLVFDMDIEESAVRQFYISWNNVQSYKVVRDKDYIELQFILRDGIHTEFSMKSNHQTQQFLEDLKLSIMSEVLVRDSRARYNYQCGGKLDESRH